MLAVKLYTIPFASISGKVSEPVKSAEAVTNAYSIDLLLNEPSTNKDTLPSSSILIAVFTGTSVGHGRAFKSRLGLIKTGSPATTLVYSPGSPLSHTCLAL